MRAPRTLGQVRVELGRLYAEARRGTLPWADACRGAYILGHLRDSLLAAGIEERIAALENAVPASAESVVTLDVPEGTEG